MSEREDDKGILGVNLDNVDTSEDKMLDLTDLANAEPDTDLNEGSDPDPVDTPDPVEETEEEKKKRKEDEAKGLVDVSLIADAEPDAIIDNKGTEDTGGKNPINDPSSDNSSSPMQKHLTALASTLRDEGVIDYSDEDVTIESATDLINIVRDQIKANEYSGLNDTQKDYLKALENGIPEETVKANFNNLDALNKISEDQIKAETSEDLRKVLIQRDFMAKGVSEAKAFKLAENSVALGNDEEDALEAYTSLKTIEGNRLKLENDRIKVEREEAEKAQKTSLSELKTKVLETEEFVKGIKPNSTTKEKIFENLSKVVGYTESGYAINAITKARLENPEEFDTMQAYLFTVTKGFKDFSTFKNAIKTNVASKLEQSLKSSNTGGGTPKEIKSSRGNGLMKALDRF